MSSLKNGLRESAWICLPAIPETRSVCVAVYGLGVPRSARSMNLPRALSVFEKVQLIYSINQRQGAHPCIYMSINMEVICTCNSSHELTERLHPAWIESVRGSELLLSNRPRLMQALSALMNWWSGSFSNVRVSIELRVARETVFSSETAAETMRLASEGRLQVDHWIGLPDSVLDGKIGRNIYTAKAV